MVVHERSVGFFLENKGGVGTASVGGWKEKGRPKQK